MTLNFPPCPLRLSVSSVSKPLRALLPSSARAELPEGALGQRLPLTVGMVMEEALEERDGALGLVEPGVSDLRSAIERRRDQRLIPRVRRSGARRGALQG